MSLRTLVLNDKDRILCNGDGLRCTVGEQLSEAHVWATVVLSAVDLYFGVSSEEVKATANFKE